MRNVYLRYALLVALILALGFGAHSGAARQPQTAGGPAPGKLPDILGLTTGMPLQQAIDLMKAHDPAHMVKISQWIIPQAFGEKPVTHHLSTATTGEDDTLDVDITLPPQPQVVWKIHRAIGNVNQFTSTLTNVLNGLYQKYGMPWNPNPGLPLGTGDLQWWFNEQGQPANPTAPADIFTRKGCQNTMMQEWTIISGSGQDLNPGQSPNAPLEVHRFDPRGGIVNLPASYDPAKNPQCDHLVFVETAINGGANDLKFSMQFWIYDYPLQHRSSIPLNDMLNAAVQRGIQQQQNDLSKAPLPKL